MHINPIRQQKMTCSWHKKNQLFKNEQTWIEQKSSKAGQRAKLISVVIVKMNLSAIKKVS